VLAMSLLPILEEALTNRPRSNAAQILVNSYGRPWTESGFNRAWLQFTRGLEAEGKIKPGLTLQGFRLTMREIFRLRARS
jgi:hypothetical protein